MARSLPVTLLMKSKIISSSPRWTFPLDFDCAFLVRRNIAICATIWSTFRPHQVKTLCTTCWNRLLTKSQCANNELKIHKTKQKISRNNEVFKLEWSIWLVSARYSSIPGDRSYTIWIAFSFLKQIHNLSSGLSTSWNSLKLTSGSSQLSAFKTNSFADFLSHAAFSKHTKRVFTIRCAVNRQRIIKSSPSANRAWNIFSQAF